MIDLKMSNGGKKYYVDISPIGSFKLVSVEMVKVKKEDDSETEVERKEVLGYYCDIFQFLERAKYKLMNVEGVQNINELLMLLIELESEMQIKVTKEIIKDKALRERVLTRIKRY